uniref:Choline/carnitine acyltransferase domain-containing protein n=1 Tax=Oncorhynchus tshawytscha TaxID=74940 RepID=A0AAZ3PUY0_ONCTS
MLCFLFNVPRMHQATLQGYLRALEPLIPKEELVHTRKKIQMFCGEGGLGPQLQEGLERRISDWWVQWAYLESRQPLPMHSNPAISLTKWDFSDWRDQRVGWVSFGWWTILDTHRKLLSVKNPAVLQFLTQTSAHGTYNHTPFKGNYIFCLAHSPSEWHTYTIHVSIVSWLKKSFFTV